MRNLLLIFILLACSGAQRASLPFNEVRMKSQPPYPWNTTTQTISLVPVQPPTFSQWMECEVTINNTNNAIVRTVGIVESATPLGPFIERTNKPVTFITGWVPSQLIQTYTNEYGIYPIWSYKKTNEVVTLKWFTTNATGFLRTYVK